MSRPRILFVDDEPNVLQGLQRMFRLMRVEWEMRFATSAKEALALMETESFAAVVTDMRMPGMDGAQLLAEVRRREPAAIRIILSGYSDAETVMRTIGQAHQFLAKPCPQQTMIDVIRRSLELNRIVHAEPLRNLLAGLKNLPSPPDCYLALVEYMRRPDASTHGLAEIIQRDVAMTAELLKLTNSSYFGLSARVSSPLQAVRILGFETLGALILRIGIFQSFKGDAALGKLVEAINQDSFLVARIGRRIAKLEGFDMRAQEEVYCAGIFCSLGLLVLLDHRPADLMRARDMVAAGTPLPAAEEAVFGATQFHVGAYLLGLWGFSKAVAEAVGFLGCPSVAQVGRLDAVGIAHAARVLAGPSPFYALAEKKPDIGRVPLDETYFRELGVIGRLENWAAEARSEIMA